MEIKDYSSFPPENKQQNQNKTEERPTSKKHSLKEKEKICANLSIENMEKIRAISRTEGLTLTDIIEASLELAIKAYEKKNGVIKIQTYKRGDVSKIFG